MALARAIFGREARDAPDFLFGHDRAAGEAPDATVDHAHAEAAGLSVGVARDAAATTAPAATTSTATTAAATAARNAAAPATSAARGEVRRRARNIRVHREAHVGVAAAEQLRLAEHDVREALESGLQDLAFRRLRDEVGDEIVRSERDARDAGGPDEITSGRSHGATAGETDVM